MSKEAKGKHIAKEQIEHIAWLARIELSEEEKEVFTDQLNEILDYFKKIDEVNTKNIPPTHHILDLMNVFREDKVQPSLPSDKALQNAPKKEGHFFKAPRIV